MEDILSSIKRIIAEENDAPPPRGRRGQRTAGLAAVSLPEEESVAAEQASVEHAVVDSGHDEVLELNDPMPQSPFDPKPQSAPLPSSAAPAAPPLEMSPMAEHTPVSKAAAGAAPTAEGGSPIVSQQTAAATRGSLDSLSRMLVKPEPASDGTLEGLVRELLRPMLRDWLDANLPPMVEAMVAREIAKITGQGG